MCHQIIQHNKFCLNKHMCVEDQMQEKQTMKKLLGAVRMDVSWPG